MLRPDVHDYLEYRTYLRDWFDHRKRVNRQYSHRLFARRAGQRSPSLLKEVIIGRRNLTEHTIEGFVRALGLKAAEARFFTHLVHLDQAKTEAERNRAWKRIAGTRRFREAHKIEGEGFQYLSQWYYPAIRELAHRADFQSDPNWVAAALRPRITPSQARRAIEALLDLGLLTRDGDGRVLPSEGSIVTAHEVEDLAVYNYHAGMLSRAAEALSEVDKNQRHYVGLTVAVPEEMVPRLKDELNRFQERVLGLCDDAEGDVDRVLQLNLHFFPVTDVVCDD